MPRDRILHRGPGAAGRPSTHGAAGRVLSVVIAVVGSWLTGGATMAEPARSSVAPPVLGAAAPVAYGPLRTVLSGPFLAGGIAADAAGDVYMVYGGSEQVVEVPHGHTQAVPLITNLSSPNSVAVDAVGDLFVTDHDKNRVVERRSGGGERVLPFTGLNSPTGVAVDAAGDVFVSDTDRLVELSKGGSQTVLAVAGLIGESASIAIDPAGDIYVVEIDQNKVVELVKGGTQTTVPLTGLNSPSSVAVDAAGDLFVVNEGGAQILERTPGGTQTVLGFASPSTAQDIAVDGAGDVFVTFNHNLVEELAAGSATAAVFPPNATSTPSGLATDQAGDVFVADPDNHVVLELAPDAVAIPLPFTGLDAPAGVAVDQAGDVFVADLGDNQVVELTKGGAQVTLPFHGLDDPRGLAVDHAGDVFVTSGFTVVSILGSSSVTPEVLELPAGGTQVTLAFTGLRNPQSLAVDRSGDVFVADGGVFVLGFGDLDAQVLELRPGGVGTTIATPDLPDVAAVGLDQAGDLFVGGSPSASSGTVGVVELPRGAPATSAGERDLPIPQADSLAVDDSGDLFVSLGFSNQVQELPIDQALLSNPVNGQLDVDTTMPFTWSTIPAAQGYDLTVGTTLYGNDLVDSGILPPSRSSLVVPALPAGELLFATLYTEEYGTWTRVQAVGFTAAGHVASFTNPRNGEANVGPNLPFTWTPDSAGQGYILVVGTSKFGHDLVDSGPLPAGQTSYTAASLPGAILNATLLTKINGAYTRYQAIRFRVAAR